MTLMVKDKKSIHSEAVKKATAKLQNSEQLGALLESIDIDELTGEDLITAMIGAVINRGLQAEMDHHLGYTHGDRESKTTTNSRNGSYTKKVHSQHGPIDVTMPRDRDGSFTPRMVPKGTRRFSQVDDIIIDLYASGMSTRDISAHLAKAMNIDVSHELVSQVTDAVLDEMYTWQHRSLDAFYPVIFLDAIRINVKDGGQTRSKSAYIAVGIDMDGIKHVLGIWVQETEGAKFWATVCAELSQRGVKDVLIVCCDGLKGLPEAIQATWPDSMVQTCVVHLIRAATRFVSYKDRKAMCDQLKEIYQAVNEDAARCAFEAFKASELGCRYPQSVKVWESAWERFVPFLQFPPQVRRIIYTTNAIESLNSVIRKATRNRRVFPSDQAAVKAIWLTIGQAEDRRALRREKAKRSGSKQEFGSGKLVEGARTVGWNQALNQLMLMFPDRFDHLV